jgi:hypothetical protein
MNPDEVLTEPTQTSPTRDQCDDEQLTDPLTWTQVETTTTDGPLHASKQQEQRSAPPDDDGIADYYYDSDDDNANGPPVNNSSIIENNNINFNRNTSTKLPPLQTEANRI